MMAAASFRVIISILLKQMGVVFFHIAREDDKVRRVIKNKLMINEIPDDFLSELIPTA